ncbi:site-2 protease family protein [Candidatus Peregrinibacteria bacterium]|nr:site-2 protease family protein [Candidatus Peregrinibacteria bacterium]
MGLDLIDLVYFLVSVAVILSVHEASHALAAYFLGDPTAKLNGRLSLNPVRHFDVLGFVMLIFVHFGWGKPVPVNTGNFKHPMRDSALTALAGPVSNFVLAFVLALPLKYMGEFLPVFVATQLWWIFDLSIIWGIFNMLPIPPLDGGKILGLIVPRRFERRFMEFQNKGLVYFAAFILLDMFVFWDVIGLFFRPVAGFSLVRFVVLGAFEFVRSVIVFGV